MAKIEHLTPAQEALLPKFRDEYFRHGTNCEPADRPRAERAFIRAYKSIGKEPVPVLWVDSPLTAQLAFAALKNLKLTDFTSDAADASLRASLWDSLGASLWDSLWDTLRDSLRDSLWDSLGDSLGASLWDSLWASLGDSLRASLGDTLRDSLRASLGDSLRASLWASLWDSLGASLWASLWASLGDSLRASLGDTLRDSLWDSKIEFHSTWWWGQRDLYWIAFYKFCAEIGVEYQPAAADKLDIMHEIGLSCMWWYPRDGLIIACERPRSFAFDTTFRLHNEAGPAVEFRDGWKVYAVHGVRVPGWIIKQPELLTIKTIEAEPNTEIQRVMIERFGWDRYAAECGAAIIDHDDRYGTLYGRNGDAEFLKVINGSPEPDGSFREYILPVAPHCEPLPDEDGGDLGAPQKLTALNAVASTYGLKGTEYRRVMELRT